MDKFNRPDPDGSSALGDNRFELEISLQFSHHSHVSANCGYVFGQFSDEKDVFSSLLVRIGFLESLRIMESPYSLL